MRVGLVVLLLAGVSLAQTAPDFSGVFLRTETRSKKYPSKPATPRVLDIKQTANEIVVSATQNRETAVIHYSLVEKKKDAPQARLKGRNLIISATYVWRVPLSGPESIADQKLAGYGLSGSTVAVLSVPRTEKQIWELSGDGQELTIRHKTNGSDPVTEVYRRESSIDSAIAAASGTTRRDCTSIVRSRERKEATNPIRKYENGVPLGIAFTGGVTRCASYDAVLSGNVFTDLKRITDTAGAHFSRADQPIRMYDGDVVLEVSAHPYACAQPGTWVPAGTPPPDMSLRLRFSLRWMGEVEKDLGELKSEFLYQPWRESADPEAFYRMHIPAKDIPLVDELEITISAETGDQLACIKGHI
jgi:hypothetical protein